jgi:hypothetical protein
MAPLSFPIHHLGGRDGEAGVTLLLQLFNQAKGNLVQTIVEGLIVVLIDQRGTLLQLIEDCVRESDAQRDCVRQPCGSPLKGGVKGLTDRLQLGNAKEGHPFLLGQRLKSLSVLL